MGALLAALPIVGNLISGLLDCLSGDKKAQAEQALKLLEMAQTEAQAQSEINKAEAASGSIFVGGWRPFIGWVCGAALAFQYIVRPFWIWAIAVWWPNSPIPPGLDSNLWELMLGMLGLGGLRSFEKVRGIGK